MLLCAGAFHQSVKQIADFIFNISPYEHHIVTPPQRVKECPKHNLSLSQLLTFSYLSEQTDIF
jgi:hypothetical protein